jgi:hypothetical protein
MNDITSISKTKEEVQKDNNTIPETFHTGEFLFTKKIITYGGTTLQLSNVTKIKKYIFSKSREPTYSISSQFLNSTLITLFLTIIIVYLGWEELRIRQFGIFTIFCCVAIIAQSIYERRIKVITEFTYALLIETASGGSEYFSTPNKNFISRLFNEITKAMDKEEFPNISANFNNYEINSNKDVNIEKIISGDNFEEIHESTIINRSKLNS